VKIENCLFDYVFLLGMDFRVSVLIFVVSIGVLTGVYVLESGGEEMVDVEELYNEKVSPAEITMYSELSSSEQRQFRTMLNDGEISESETDLDSKYRFIELDSRVYEVDSSQEYGLIMFPAILGLFGSVVGLLMIRDGLRKRNKELFDFVLSVCMASVILLLLFTGSGGSVWTESQIAMSTVPVDVEDDSSTIDIQYIRDDSLRDDLFDSMKGGDPVSEESLSDSDFFLILSGHSGDYSSFVERYEYVSSDGEYYKITLLDDQVTGHSILVVGMSFMFSSAWLLYGFFSLFNYAGYLKEEE